MNASFLCNNNATIAEDAAEAYVLRRMNAEQIECYEEHLLTCPRCQDAVRDFDVFLATARMAFAEKPAQQRRAGRPRTKSASR